MSNQTAGHFDKEHWTFSKKQYEVSGPASIVKMSNSLIIIHTFAANR